MRPLTLKEWLVSGSMLVVFLLMSSIISRPVVVQSAPIPPANVQFPQMTTPPPRFASYPITQPGTGFPGIAIVDQNSGSVSFQFYDPPRPQGIRKGTVRLHLERLSGYTDPRTMITITESGSKVLPMLYADMEGRAVLPDPVIADREGHFAVWVTPGAYDVRDARDRPLTPDPVK